jgi:hypothetical protein
VVTAAYVDAAIEPLARNDVLTLAVSGAIALAALHAFGRASGPARKASGPALASALAYSGVLALDAGARLAGSHNLHAQLWAYDIVIATVAIVLFVDLLRGRSADAIVIGLVVDLGTPSEAGMLQAKLARSLGDPSLVVGYRVADIGLVDDAGPSSSSRCRFHFAYCARSSPPTPIPAPYRHSPTQRELVAAVAELRDLARGIFPSVLADGGLAVAVRALAEDGPVPLRIGRLPPGRFTPAVETASYTVVAEAARAAAGPVAIEAEERDGLLVVLVEAQVNGELDDQALADRLGALDGRLTVDERDGGKVTIRAELPCGS